MLEMHDSWTIEVFISHATATVLRRDATFKVGRFILGGRVIDEIDKSLFFLTAFPNVTNEAIITVMRATPLVVGAFKKEEEEEEEEHDEESDTALEAILQAERDEDDAAAYHALMQADW